MPEAAAASNSPNEETPRSERNFWVMVGVPVALAVMLVGIVGLAIFFMSQSEEPGDHGNERVVPAGRAQPKEASPFTTGLASGKKSTEATGRKLNAKDKSANDKVVLGKTKPSSKKGPKEKPRHKWRIDHGAIPVPTERTTTPTTTRTTTTTTTVWTTTEGLDVFPDLGVPKLPIDEDLTTGVLPVSSTDEAEVISVVDVRPSPNGTGDAELVAKQIDNAEEETEEQTTPEEAMPEAEASIAASVRLGLHADSRLTFDEATTFCREVYDEGTLLITHTLDEELFLTKQLQQDIKDLAACDAIFIGFHGNGTKRFLSMDGSQFVDGFETAHGRSLKDKRPLPEEDSNCILIKPLLTEVLNMSCKDTAPCVVCESKTRCQNHYVSPWGVCYLPRTSTRTELMSLSEADAVCSASSVRGRVAMFVDQHVPLPVIAELKVSARDRSTFGCHTGEFIARSVRLNPDLETFDGEPMAYRSMQFDDFAGSEHDCVAVIPGEEFRWKRVPCDVKSCFLCRVPAPHYTSKRQLAR